MKKLMTGILLGAVVLTSTSMSFAAGNEKIGEKAKTCVAAKPIIQAEIGDFHIKSLGAADIIKINGENGIIKINGVDFKKIDGDSIAIDEEILKKLGKDNIEIAIDNLAELQSFEDFMKSMKEILKDINEKDKKDLEKFYNEAASLEKAKKFDEASKKWSAFDKILGKYFKDGEIISGKTIQINGDDLIKIDGNIIEFKIDEAN